MNGVFLAVALLTSADPNPAIVHVGGCTGFVVRGNLLVTARHCDPGSQVSIKIEGRSVIGTLAVRGSGDDGPLVYALAGGPYPSLPIATHKPARGDPAYAEGYPSGYWSHVEGKVISGEPGQNYNVVDFRINPGMSGCPLMNSAGEVEGVATSVASDLGDASSQFVSWKYTVDAIQKAAGSNPVSEHNLVKQMTVVFFVTTGCAPCSRLEAAYKAGAFKDYNVVINRWNPKAETWSNAELYNEFVQTRAPGEQLAFPTIWIRGTRHTRVGFGNSEPRGLLGWLGSLLKVIHDGLFGPVMPPAFPVPDDISQPGLVPPSLGDAGQLDLESIMLNIEDVKKGLDEFKSADIGGKIVAAVKMLEDVKELAGNTEDMRGLAASVTGDVGSLKELVAGFAKDLKDFKSAGAIGKLGMIGKLKGDEATAESLVGVVKEEIQKVRSQNDVPWYWGLPAVLLGIVKRRYLNKGMAV